MSDNPMFECWCAMFTKLKIYKDRIEVKSMLGLNTLSIPISKIASVNNGFTGIKFETTGGVKTEPVQPYDSKKKAEAVKLILKLIS